MASARGCFKNGCLGCLGFIVLMALILGITALLAKNDAKNSTPVDEVLAPVPADDRALADGHNGRVVLNLSQGDFAIYPANPGEGLRVEAIYDDELFDLEQEFVTLPDSSWQYDLNFLRVGSGLRSFMQSIFSKGPSAKIAVYLPPDVSIELVADVSKGGFEGDFGGLWLSSADLKIYQGGFALEISEPMKEPMDSFIIRSSMGGFAAEGLGNASPRVLDVNCSMGGAEMDLSGNWLNDCDANFAVKMGGMSIYVPRNVSVLRGANDLDSMSDANPEIAKPILRIRTQAKYGEIEIQD